MRTDTDDDRVPGEPGGGTFELVIAHSSVAAVAGFRVPISTAVTVGRAPDLAYDAAGGRLGVADSRLSESHCRLWPHDGALVVEDTASKNGTWVDGRRIKNARLSENSVLRIGTTILVCSRQAAPLVAPGRNMEFHVPWTGHSSFAFELRSRIGAFKAQIAAEFEALNGSANAQDPRQPRRRIPGAFLIHGPTGSGKSALALCLRNILRPDTPFEVVACAALRPNAQVADIFGNHSGAGQSATRRRDGHAHRAGSGVLVLENVDALSATTQVALHDFLDIGLIHRTGSPDSSESEFRRPVIIATTSAKPENLEPGLRARLPRCIEVPPLVRRVADILPLAQKLAGRELMLSHNEAETLLLHDWPRNAHELRDVVLDLCAGRGCAGLAAHRPHAAPASPEPIGSSGVAARRARLKALLPGVLQKHGGKVAPAARELGCSRDLLYDLLRQN